MRYRALGPSGIEASVVGFGAWAIGGWLWGGTDEVTAIGAIHAALDAGINLIDTAPVYGQGLSEQIIGKAIAGRREQVVLATKCGLVWDSSEGVAFIVREGKEIRKHLRPESIRRELEASLTRLGSDYVDLYQTHWQDPTAAVADVMSTLLDLKREGKIRAIGVSNATVADMDAYRKLGPLDSDQERYNMLDRGIEQVQLPYGREHDMAVLAYSPLGQGLLTGKITQEREFPPGDLRRDHPNFSLEMRRRVAAMLEQFKPIAHGHGLTFAQLAIAWTVAQPGLTHALVGARSPRQARENAGAGDAVLNAEELAHLDALIASHAGTAGAE
ncbi:MAG TPA: aldo/keto reductase [Armatimonadota bacterium]|nr:aldo/keto reductase [Armatimonadota bacterium]